MERNILDIRNIYFFGKKKIVDNLEWFDDLGWERDIVWEDNVMVFFTCC